MADVDTTGPLTMGDGRQPIRLPQPAASSRAGRSLPPGYIQLGVAMEIAPTLRDLGLDPNPVIWEAGLDPRLFDDGANVIPHAALG